MRWKKRVGRGKGELVQGLLPKDARETMFDTHIGLGRSVKEQLPDRKELQLDLGGREISERYVQKPQDIVDRQTARNVKDSNADSSTGDDRGSDNMKDRVGDFRSSSDIVRLSCKTRSACRTSNVYLQHLDWFRFPPMPVSRVSQALSEAYLRSSKS